MEAQQRWQFALALVLVDIVAVFVPVAAIGLAYVVIARPPWFREWVEKLYDLDPHDGGK